tara:strand:- start:842 stop:1060 length:219 start_codon:yes stop_codon:yes gene_type:complete
MIEKFGSKYLIIIIQIAKKIVATDGINSSSCMVKGAKPIYLRAAKFKKIKTTKKYSKPTLDFAQYRQYLFMT